nr:putative sigma factor [uncultured Mediterranean phage uvMED]
MKLHDFQPVADNNTEEKKTSVGDDESKRWRQGRGPSHKVEERAQVCYGYILEGGTRHQIAAKMSARFNISIRTGHDDYKRAMQLLREEQQGTREELLNQLQALRLATVQRALKRGHYQTVATLLGDMGRVIGEAAPEQLALQVPTLDIRIENENQSQ